MVCYTRGTRTTDSSVSTTRRSAARLEGPKELGIAQDDTIPPDVEGQTRLCFENIGAILKEAGMWYQDIVRINAYVTGREHMAGYMKIRDEFTADPPPASTLMIVDGFTREEFVVEVEVIAAKAD